MYGFKSPVQELFVHQDGCQENVLILALLSCKPLGDIFTALRKKEVQNADIKLYRVLLTPKKFYDLALLSLYLRPSS